MLANMMDVGFEYHETSPYFYSEMATQDTKSKVWIHKTLSIDHETVPSDKIMPSSEKDLKRQSQQTEKQ